MGLTDTTIRQAKHEPKPIKLGVERGLFLLLQPSRGKLWRLKYRFAGKEKKLSLRIYPDISLSEARRRRDEARTLIANGTTLERCGRLLATTVTAVAAALQR